jgi:hypothetical protein
MSLRVVGVVLLALLIAFLAGWGIGTSGRSAAETERRRAGVAAQFAEARADVLAGRVSLFVNNFGDAIKHFQEARDVVGRLQNELREQGLADQAGHLSIALSQLSEAQQLSGKLDGHAQTPAEQALQTLDAVRQGG